MFKIYEHIFRCVTITVVFQIDTVVSNFENNPKHLEEISQIVSNSSLRDNLDIHPLETIDRHLGTPKSEYSYSAIENNTTNEFWERFIADHELERELLRMPSQQEGRNLDYTVRTDRSLILKKKKIKLLKIKSVLFLVGLMIKWKKIILTKLLVLLVVVFKLKFLMVFPVLATGLFLLVGSAGMAGFFFALFAAAIGLKGWNIK